MIVFGSGVGPRSGSSVKGREGMAPTRPREGYQIGCVMSLAAVGRMRDGGACRWGAWQCLARTWVVSRFGLAWLHWDRRGGVGESGGGTSRLWAMSGGVEIGRHGVGQT